MIKRFVVILVFLFTLTGCTANNDTMTDTNTEANIEINTETVEVSIEYQKLSTEEKVEDFEFLFDTLSSNYPYFEMNKRLYAVDWLGNKEVYRKRIEDTEGDLEFYLVLNSIMNDLNYGHAGVLNDNLYAHLLSGYRNVAAEPWLEILENPVVQSRYSKVVETQVKENATEEYAYPNNISLEKWTDISTAYIKINSFNHFNIEGDWEVLQPFLNDLEDVKSLIIDIRGNTGGDSRYWSEYLVKELLDEQKEFSQYYCFRGGEYSERFVEFFFGAHYSELEVIGQEFIEELSPNLPEEVMTDFAYYLKSTKVIEPMDEQGYRGDIYLLVDQRVFSSAETLVQFARDTEFAYIIGEATSGESAGFDSILLSLPNSGYVIRFPGVMVLSSMGINIDERIVNPDLLVDGKRALEEALELIHNKTSK